MSKPITKQKVANGIFWVDIPDADLRILCGCPADAVKHLILRGLVAPTPKNGVACETGPNAILLSDTPIQKGTFANLSEFPLLQILYRQGMILPGHPNNTGRRPMIIGLGDVVRSQGEYIARGNYGLLSVEELEAAGASGETAREIWAIKKWFAFGDIRPTESLVDLRPIDADAVELAPGAVIHRRGFNRYEFISGGRAEEVDLTLGPEEEFEPAYSLPRRPAARQHFSVIHLGEGDGWDTRRPCMGSMVCADGRFYLVDAGPHIRRSLGALGLRFADIDGIFHTHCHDDHFAGLTSMVRADRRMKYYAVPWVRASVQKKLCALMRIEESRFASFFDVHDLVEGEWNRIGVLEVKPVFSPHPVETTVFFFRSADGGVQRTYAHLADIASFKVLGRLAGVGGTPAVWPEARRSAFVREIGAPVDVKKIDAGGGLIHGEADDFRDDQSAKVLLSHGVPEMRDHGKRTDTVVFGDCDALLPGGTFAVRAEEHPSENPAFLEILAACPSFRGITDTSVLARIAAAASERQVAAGSAVPQEAAPTLMVLARGEADIAVGAQLIETLFPGGIWGAERIASSAPPVSSATAVTDCVFLAVPGDVLKDIPCLQWEILETYQRRVRSFRAGFQFAWSESFRVNVALLDDQHRELFSRVNTLSSAIGASGTVEGHEPEKRAVLEYARTHFADEEALMEKHGYSRLPVQKPAHETLVRQLEQLTEAPERRARPRLETAVDFLKDWLISHTLLEDLQYRDFFASKGLR